MLSQPRPKKTINQVVAENLAHYMRQRGFTQVELASAAGISQKTVSNYLNPQQRGDSASGKEKSAKLTELDRIAQALGVEVWQLTRHTSSEQERLMYETLEQAVARLRETVQSEQKIDLPPSDEEVKKDYDRSRTSVPPAKSTTVRKRA